MISVLKKELRELRIVTWTMLIMVVVGYSFVPFVRIDELAIVALCPKECGPAAVDSGLWRQLDVPLIALMVYVLFVREREMGTIEFVSALPVSRAKLFLIKILTALLVFFCYKLAPLFVSIALLQFNSQFLRDGFEDFYVAEYTLLSLLFVSILISQAVLFSYFRVVGLFFYFVFTVFTIAIASLFPRFEWLQVWSVLEVDELSSGLELNHEAIYRQGIGAVMALFGGYLLWSGAGVVKAKHLIASRGRQWLWPLVSFVFVAICVSGFMATTLFISNVSVDDEEFLSEASRVKSDRYTFNFKSDDKDKFEDLREQADDDFDALVQLLGSDIPGTRIFVDGTRRISAIGAAGVAIGRRIGIDVEASGDGLRQVLSHETVHVYQYTESKGKFHEFPEAKFFIEGMAEYYSFLVAPDADRKRKSLQPGIVLAQRYHITLKDVMEDKSFVDKFGYRPYYPLGHLWTQALVENCGEQIITEFLRAMPRQRGRRGLRGEQWWRITLNELDCNFDAAKELWEEKLAETVSESDLAYYPLLTRDKVEFLTHTAKLDFVVEQLDEEKMPLRYFLFYGEQTGLFAHQSIVEGHRLMAKQADGKVRIRFVIRGAIDSTIRYRVGYYVRGTTVPYAQPVRRIAR